MSEKVKQTHDTDDPAEGNDEIIEEDQEAVARYLGPRFVDFISVHGVLRAFRGQRTRLEIAPRDSAVWAEYRKELGRRSLALVDRINEQLSKVA